MGITTITAVLGAVLLCTVSLGAASAELTCSDADFQAWVNEHRPSEFEKEEYETRKALYCKTVERVAAHNEKFKNGESSFFMKVNQFAAHTVEERRTMFGTMPSKDNEGPVKEGSTEGL